MKKLFLLALLLFPSSAFAQASVSCNAGLGETAVLSSFADNVPGGITPRNLRDYVCSMTAGSVAFTTPFTITGPNQTNTEGLVVTTNGQTAAQTVSNAHFPWNSITVNNDNINLTPANFHSSGLEINLNVGANAGGSKYAINARTIQTATPSNTTGDYIGGSFGAQGQASNPSGSLYGSQSSAQAQFNNLSYFITSGAEFDNIVSGTVGMSITNRFGIDIVSQGSVLGTTRDAGIELGATTGSGFTQGIMLSTLHGGSPIATTGTVIGTDGVGQTVANGIDFSVLTITGSLLKGPGSVNILGTGHFGWNPQFDFQVGTGAGMWFGDAGTHTGQQIFFGSDSGPSNTFRIFFGGVGGSNTNVLVATGTSVAQLVTVNGTFSATSTITGSQFASGIVAGVSCAAGTTSAATLAITGGIVTHC